MGHRPCNLKPRKSSAREPRKRPLLGRGVLRHAERLRRKEALYPLCFSRGCLTCLTAASCGSVGLRIIWAGCSDFRISLSIILNFN